MRNTFLPALACLLLAAGGCQRAATVQEVMDTEAKRKEVYTTIMEHPEMRQEMMQVMREHPQGRMMMGSDMMSQPNMMGDSSGIMGGGHMMGRRSMMNGGAMMGDSATGMGGMNQAQMHSMMQQMMNACTQDSANCNMMSQMMLQHPQMMHNMMQQMHQQGMMGDACYQQMMGKLPKQP